MPQYFCQCSCVALGSAREGEEAVKALFQWEVLTPVAMRQRVCVCVCGEPTVSCSHLLIRTDMWLMWHTRDFVASASASACLVFTIRADVPRGQLWRPFRPTCSKRDLWRHLPVIVPACLCWSTVLPVPGGAGVRVKDGTRDAGPLRVRQVHNRWRVLHKVPTWRGSGEGMRRHSDSLCPVFGQWVKTLCTCMIK